MGAIEPQFYALLREKIGATDAAFDPQNDSTAWPALKEKTAALFAQKSRDEWCALLEGSDACFAPVLNWDEAINHPHNRARDTCIDIEGVIQPAPAPRFSRTPPAPPSAVAAVGEHSDAILRDWGVDAATITTLRANGVI